jgi:hypothetical protein
VLSTFDIDLRFLLLAYSPSILCLVATRNEALTIQSNFGENILLAELVLVVEIARLEDNDNESPDLLSGHCERCGVVVVLRAQEGAALFYKAKKALIG